MNMMRLKYLLPSLMLLAAALAGAETDYHALPVKAVLFPIREATLSTPVDGMIAKCRFRAGQRFGKDDCSIDSVLESGVDAPECKISEHESEVIDAWDEFHCGIRQKTLGFPVWAEWFQKPSPDSSPEWKRRFIVKNNLLYQGNKSFIDAWLERHNGLSGFTPTERKMEWQAGESIASAWDGIIQFRPSGIRIRRPDCFPALVAMVQIPIVGKLHRRMTIREAARLQSFPDSFVPNENAHDAYKQFGNAVNVEVIRKCAMSLLSEEPSVSP